MRHGILSLTLIFALALLAPLSALAQPVASPPPEGSGVALTPPAGPAEAVPVAVPEVAPVPLPEVAPVVVSPSPSPVVAPVVPVPVEPVDVPSGVGQVVTAYQAGGWLAAGAAAVMLLTLLLRILGILDRVPKRWRVVVPLALGCVSALLAAVAGGMDWGQAALIAFLTGPAAVGLHQGIARSLMGVEGPDRAAGGQ